MSFPTFSTDVARPAAAVAAIIFVVVACFQVFWALGGSWGLSAAWGGAHTELSAGLRGASTLTAILLVVGVVVVIGRAGYWSFGIPFSVFRWGTWVFVAVFALSTLANFASSSNWERFLNGPIALLLTILCLIVARSVVPPR